MKYGNVAELIETLKAVRCDCAAILAGEVEIHGKPVKFDMTGWVEEYDSVCYVCLAGTQLIKEGLIAPFDAEHGRFYSWLDAIRFMPLGMIFTWDLFDRELAERIAGTMPHECLGIGESADVLRGLDRLIGLLERYENSESNKSSK